MGGGGGEGGWTSSSARELCLTTLCERDEGFGRSAKGKGEREGEYLRRLVWSRFRVDIHGTFIGVYLARLVTGVMSVKVDMTS